MKLNNFCAFDVIRTLGTSLAILSLFVPLDMIGTAQAARTSRTWGTRWIVHETPNPSSRAVGMINRTRAGQNRINQSML